MASFIEQLNRKRAVARYMAPTLVGEAAEEPAPEPSSAPMSLDEVRAAIASNEEEEAWEADAPRRRAEAIAQRKEEDRQRVSWAQEDRGSVPQLPTHKGGGTQEVLPQAEEIREVCK